MLRLSALPKTWLIDLDGTIFPHNGYLRTKDAEKLLVGAKDFFEKIAEDDIIIILTSRDERYRRKTVESLKSNGIKFNLLLMGVPKGERILINDKKASGMKTAYAINLKRDSGLNEVKIEISDDSNNPSKT
jgi:hypothetical protein